MWPIRDYETDTNYGQRYVRQPPEVVCCPWVSLGPPRSASSPGPQPRRAGAGRPSFRVPSLDSVREDVGRGGPPPWFLCFSYVLILFVFTLLLEFVELFWCLLVFYFFCFNSFCLLFARRHIPLTFTIYRINNHPFHRVHSSSI